MTTEIQIIEYKPTELALKTLKEKYNGVIFDVTSTKGMDAAKKARSEIKEYRIDLEKKRKELKADILEKGKLIDGEAKRITLELESIELPIDNQIKAEEKRKEEERKAKEELKRLALQAIQDKIAIIKNAPTKYIGKSSNEIGIALKNAQDFILDESFFGLYIAQAEQAKNQAVENLQSMLSDAISYENEQAKIKAEREELERLRAEQQKRQQEEELKAKQEREKHEAEMKEQREKQEAEMKAQREKHEAEMKEQREKQEAEMKARLDEERKKEVERIRIQKEKDEKAKQELKEKQEALLILRLTEIDNMDISQIEKLKSAYNLGFEDSQKL